MEHEIRKPSLHNGVSGLSGGGELAERRLNAAREHFKSNEQESVKIGLELLKNCIDKKRINCLIEMGLSLDDWIPHINEHGEEPLDGSNEMSEPTEDPLLDRLASEELDSLERKILDEMRKASKQLGGPFSKNEVRWGKTTMISRWLKIWSGIPMELEKAISFKNMCNPSYRMKPRMFFVQCFIQNIRCTILSVKSGQNKVQQMIVKSLIRLNRAHSQGRWVLSEICQRRKVRQQGVLDN